MERVQSGAWQGCAERNSFAAGVVCVHAYMLYTAAAAAFIVTLAEHSVTQHCCATAVETRCAVTARAQWSM